MELEYLICDICKTKHKYPSGLENHQHPELEIGGVPMNIWTPVYYLTRFADSSRSGIKRFQQCIPFEINKKLSDKEGNTPLIKLGDNVYLKDESINPTHSFKDRGMVALVSDVLKSGKRRVTIPSTGNAAISLGYYARKTGLETIVFVPKNTSLPKKKQIERNSEVIYDKNLVASYEHFFEFCKLNPSVYNGFPTINIPYLQGVKTIAYEIFLDLGKVPDWIIIPVGSGGNAIAQYQGFKDLIGMGLTNKMPRFATVQIKGADPITVGYENKRYDEVVVIENPAPSKAEAISSDTCFNYFKIMVVLNNTRGLAISVEDEEISEIDKKDPLDLEFSSKSVYVALDKLRTKIGHNDKVVMIGTAGTKNET